jgi:ABC-type multidrug transport system fused ATPase/permease subunit
LDTAGEPGDLALLVLGKADWTTFTEGVSITPRPNPMSNSPGAKAHSFGECLTTRRRTTTPAIVVTNPVRINVRCWKRFASAPAARWRRKSEALVLRPLLDAACVRAGYQGVEVIDGENLRTAPENVTAILGTNGSGKSTLLLVLSGLNEMSGGQVFFDGELVTVAEADGLGPPRTPSDSRG